MRPFRRWQTGTLSAVPLFSTIALFVSCLVSPACGQVAVYDLSFQRSEQHSINFIGFDGGYLVLNLATGLGSFLFTFVDAPAGGTPQPSYVQAGESVQAFTAVHHPERKTVIRATAQTGTAISHYLATGLVDREITAEIGGKPVRVALASMLSGRLLASDDESDVVFPPGATAMGFAGMSAFDLMLNPHWTDRANRAGETVSQALQTLARSLERLGFREAGRP